MNKQSLILALLICVTLNSNCFSQNEPTKISEQEASLFSEKEILPIKLSFSIKDIKKETNDSTYIASRFKYKNEFDLWDSLDVKIRARGNFRLKNCYFPPIKLKFKKSDLKETIFKGEKRLKLVLPCINQSDKNDNVIKEYIAYKIFEIISPYYFKVRMVDIEFEELKKNKSKIHLVKGFLIEDDERLAKRIDGKVYDRSVHPLQQDDLTSVRNAFFQFMIGNTDFSQAYQHNVKLIFVEKKITPVPYDFDLAGLVNCSYAIVSQIGDKDMGIESVTQRKFRGFKRDMALFEQVRNEFIEKKPEIMATIDACQSYFDNEKEFSVARNYVLDFFEIIANERKYKNQILDQARLK